MREGRECAYFCGDRERAYLLEDVLLSIQFDVLSIAGSIKGNRGQSEREQALRIFRDGHHPGPKVLIATDESVGSAEDIPTVDIVVSYDMPDTIEEYERRIGRARSNGMATSFFTFEDAHLARDLERTLIYVQQEVPRFLKVMRVARFSYQEGDHVVSLIDFHGVRKGDVGLVLGPCCDKKKVDWAERMQVSFGKGRQTEKCDYVRWHMRMANEHEVGAWEHVYDYDQRNSKFKVKLADNELGDKAASWQTQYQREKSEVSEGTDSCRGPNEGEPSGVAADTQEEPKLDAADAQGVPMLDLNQSEKNEATADAHMVGSRRSTLPYGDRNEHEMIEGRPVYERTKVSEALADASGGSGTEGGMVLELRDTAGVVRDIQVRVDASTSVSQAPCSGTKERERRSHPHPVGGRQALPLHPPRRDSRHAHGNAHARIRPRRHLRHPRYFGGRG